MKDKENLFVDTSSNQDCLKIQLNTYDCYQSAPSFLDRKHPPNHEEYSYYQVPIMRIFGSLTTGHKVICHVHGFFPYLYIPYDNQDCFKLHLKIENAMVNSFKRSNNSKTEKDSRILKYIANISVCKGIPFYGFHVGYNAFYKISLINPSCSNRLADILRSGEIGRSYDVYENHISSGLQFLSDFNLFGCGWIKINNLTIRCPIFNNDKLNLEELNKLISIYKTNNLDRIGNSLLEFDILTQDIMNRLELSQRDLHSNFIEKFQTYNSNIYIQSTKDLWKDGNYQRKVHNEPEYSSPNLTKRVNNNKWVEEENNQSMFDYIKNLNLPEDAKLDFSNFVKPDIAMDAIPVCFDIIDELFHEPELELSADSEDRSSENSDNLFAINDEYNQEMEYFNNFDEINSDNEDGYEKELDEPKEAFIDMLQKSNELADPNNTISDFYLTQRINSKFNHLKSSYSTNSQKASLGHNFHLKKINENSINSVFHTLPPDELNFDEIGLPKIQYDDPFFMEAPPKPFVHGSKKFTLESKQLEYSKLADFNGETIEKPKSIKKLKLLPSANDVTRWRYIIDPPTYEELENINDNLKSQSQLEITQNFKFKTQKSLDRRPDGFSPLSSLVMELFILTRGDFKPDPNQDGIEAIFWKFINDSSTEEGIFIINPRQAIPEGNVQSFDNEMELILRFCDHVRNLDPDLLTGYEVHSSSWGYLIDRGNARYELEIMKELSRVSSKGKEKFGDHWGSTHTSGIQVTGRHVINIWRHLRQLKLPRNNIEYVTFHLLHERLPHFTEKSLTIMYEHRGFLHVLKHFMRKINIDFKLIESTDIIARASEEARLIGIDFYDVFYRGSQYKVESLMIRIAKAENFILYSASKKQVRKQKPLECIPLVMEPISAFYKSPLVVLDFQSLYPSIIIAYNYCYSTLLGRLRNYKPNELNPIGVTKIEHPVGLLKLLENDVTLSPNGLMFVKKSIRKSLLAKMLEDILDTRFMVKSTMKFLDESMKKLYNNRQLALKLTANVTYGYASASFSGRMPCSDIADAIVQTGRETLEAAIKLIEDNETWGAKVVYGDTDSLFVYLPGKSQEDAFHIGNDIAKQVTENNPNPVTLKFEKVYHPSVLLAKKRYVGYSRENLTDEPKFDAKGIETVRRDGHFAQQYITEKSLRVLFDTANMSTLKKFIQTQFSKILLNDVSIQDFCFAKDVKIGHYKNPPPGAIVSMKKMEVDTRAEPQYKERVPYVIIKSPGKILRERAVSPEDFIKNDYELDSKYYIEKTLIPPLERIFNLMGVDIKQWYNEMPKKITKHLLMFKTDNCLICGVLTKKKLCSDCEKDEMNSIFNLRMQMKDVEVKLKNTILSCKQTCDSEIPCESIDCPNYLKRVKYTKILKEQDEAKRQLKW